MSRFKETIATFGRRSLAVSLALLASATMLLAQNAHEKYSLTTQMFLNELKQQTDQPKSAPRRSLRHGLTHNQRMPKARRLVASPDTVGGVAYISCFIHLKDVADLSQVRSLGVEVEETFDGQDFVTARVPVSQVEKLADIDNVTQIKVARQMRPLTDMSRQLTKTDDVLTYSADAIAGGLPAAFDGTGVVLGIIDTGIDFQHIAFKDKDGGSRIKRAYVYNGSSATEYTSVSGTSPTTDDDTQDHGTHTASTAGGSSVIVNGTSVTVTDNHESATFGGMAPGSDLYLAGIKDLSDTYITNALKKMVSYADSQNKPLVVSNSWGSGWGPRDGTGEVADLVGQYFGDSHPNRVILFASSNDAGHGKDNEGGGFFVKKNGATSASPLGTIMRCDSYSDTDAGYMYYGLIAYASGTSKMNCKIHVLNSNTGALLKTWTVTNNSPSVSLGTYYEGTLSVYMTRDGSKYSVAINSDEGIETTGYTGYNYSKSNYTLAFEVYPASGSADINVWAGDYSYFTNHLTTSGHTWTAGTDDMSVSDEATIPNAISVGAYVSKNRVKNYKGSTYTYSSGSLGDIASFSSYATPELSPTGEAYPWITAPGAQVVAAVNHYDTDGSYSYYNADNASQLVVNSSTYPYGVMQGTSMSTPVAAGIVALWLQAAQTAGTSLTVNDVKNIMAETAITDSYTNGPNSTHFGKGKIDALAGIRYILGNPEPPEPVGTSRYKLVKDATTLAAGDRILVAHLSENGNYVLGTTQRTNNRAATDDVVMDADGMLLPGKTAQVITLEQGTDGFLFNVGTGYLYAASSNSNSLKTKTAADANATAAISIAADGRATVKFQGTNTRNLLCFNANNGTPIYSCYGGSSTVAQLPQIYREVTDIALDKNAVDNTSVIQANTGKRVNATLDGCTFYRDSYWNTICLPFDVSIAGSPLEGADVRALNEASLEDGTLTLNFTDEGAVDKIAAGTPYILRWQDGTDIANPVFEDVKLTAETNDFTSTDGKVRFVGTFNYKAFDTEDKSILFMDKTNTLSYPAPGARVGAFRSYFQISEESPVKRFVLNLGDDPDGIEAIDHSPLTIDHSSLNTSHWYNLAGQMVNGKSVNGKLPKGIYIVNGKKILF